MNIEMHHNFKHEKLQMGVIPLRTFKFVLFMMSDLCCYTNTGESVTA